MEETRKAGNSGTPILSKWLMPLFWLNIPQIAALILRLDQIAALHPAIGWFGELLNFACALIYAGILFRLGTAQRQYRAAGIFCLLDVAISLFVRLAVDQTETMWLLLLFVPAVYVRLAGVYNEYTAHREVLAGEDDARADRWYVLRKWCIGLTCTMTAGILLLFAVPFIGYITLLIVVTGLIILDVLRMVNLYATAKLFKHTCQDKAV